MHQVDRLERQDCSVVVVDHLISGDRRSAIVAAGRRRQFQDTRADPHPVAAAKRALHPVIVEADAAHEVDVAVDAMVELTPDSEQLDSAGDDFAEYRLFGRFDIAVKPLRVILPREIDDFLGGYGWRSFCSSCHGHNCVDVGELYLNHFG